MKKLKAIDLYSGIGGWSLGLKLNEIEVVNSYEWWQQAIDTSNANFGRNEESINIRKMNFFDLADKNIDIVVGSPPCTQFSYSNRGGSGDIDDGIIDLYKFFECVSVIKPKFWAMENVPRVAKVLKTESSKGGQLFKFKKIIDEGFIEVFNMRDYGVPQKRKRCIASNINLELFESYQDLTEEINLGSILSSLSKERIKDVNFKVSKTKNSLTEMEKEEALNPEEERMNRDMKINHPIYNRMSFPEDESLPARTITATCTRVSRESLIIKDKRKYRRLSVRERGSIQGFPINFEFHGSSHSNKLKMIGNAIPPKFTYFIAAAMREIRPEKLVLPKNKSISLQKSMPPKTFPDSQSKKYPANRSFKFALPNFNFKSGTRFELNNSEGKFRCYFYYGDSKRIRELSLDKQLIKKLNRFILKIDENILNKLIEELKLIVRYDQDELQSAWSVKPSIGKHPFEVLDLLNSTGNSIEDLTADIEEEKLFELIPVIFNEKDDVGLKKITHNFRKIFCCMYTCAYFNSIN